MKKRVPFLLGICVLVAVCAGILFTKSSQPYVLSMGVDSYNTHRLLFGDAVFSQTITNQRPITAIGLLVVNIRRSKNVPPVEVFIKDTNGNQIARGTIKPKQIRDDTFAYISFKQPLTIPPDGAILYATAPEATNNNAIGWRYDPSQTGLARYENDNPQDGMFAVAVKEQVPTAQAIVTFIQANITAVLNTLYIMGIFLGFGILASELGWRNRSHKTKRIIQWGVIFIIIITAFSTRMYAQSGMGGVSGGDPYNYLLIAKSLVHGENPFTSSKRLPGYPLLLTPALIWPSIDAQVYMRTLSALAAMVVLILTFTLTRILRLTWPAQLFAVAALAWQSNFFATSLRPEPYSLFGLLLLACLILFFTAKKPFTWVLFGVLLGYSAMVRQEGFVLAAVLGAAAVVREAFVFYKHKSGFAFNRLLWMFVPAFILVLPFFISNTFSFGNPLYTPYFEGEKLEIVDSPQAFHDASISTWSIITSMWKPSWTQQELLMPYDHWLIPVSLFAAIVWWVCLIHRKRRRVPWWLQCILIALGLASTIGTAYLMAVDVADAARFAPMIVAGVLLVAPALFLVKTTWRGILVFAVLVSQLLVATWFHPYAKHYQQSYPLIMIMIAATLFNLPPILRRYRVTHVFASATWIAPFAITLVILYSHLGIFVDANNAASALDSVLYRAVRATEMLPAPYGYTLESLPEAVFNNSDDVRSVDGNTIPADVRTLIIGGDSKEVMQPDDSWQEQQRFLSEGKDEVLYRATVYTKK